MDHVGRGHWWAGTIPCRPRQPSPSIPDPDPAAHLQLPTGCKGGGGGVDAAHVPVNGHVQEESNLPHHAHSRDKHTLPALL